MDPEHVLSAADLLTSLASRGRYHVTTGEAAAGTKVSVAAARAALRRLKQKGVVAVPYRGFHVIVPPEYRRLGCLPAEQFIPQLMEHLGEPYYVGLLSAAQYHGAAHQRPQVFLVVVPKNRPPIRCGLVRVGFVGRHNTRGMETARFNTPRGPVAVSTPEVTAFDLVGYPRHAGGLDNVATVLAELGEALSFDRLVEIAPLSPVPWAQRLGFMLESLGYERHLEALARFVRKSVTETAALSTAHEVCDARRDARWKLAINVELEPDV